MFIRRPSMVDVRMWTSIQNRHCIECKAFEALDWGGIDASDRNEMISFVWERRPGFRWKLILLAQNLCKLYLQKSRKVFCNNLSNWNFPFNCFRSAILKRTKRTANFSSKNNHISELNLIRDHCCNIWRSNNDEHSIANDGQFVTTDSIIAMTVQTAVYRLGGLCQWSLFSAVNYASDRHQISRSCLWFGNL